MKYFIISMVFIVILLAAFRCSHASHQLIFIHGGSWIGGTAEFAEQSRLEDAGFDVISIDYTLVDEEHNLIDSFSDIAEQIKALPDADSVHIIAESAGAHYASVLLSNPDFLDEAYNKVDTFILISAVYDMKQSLDLLIGALPFRLAKIRNHVSADDYEINKPTYNKFCTQVLKFDGNTRACHNQNILAKTSAYSHLKKSAFSHKPIVYLFHGDKDILVGYKSDKYFDVEDFNTLLIDKGINSQLVIFNGASHYGLNNKSMMELTLDWFGI